MNPIKPEAQNLELLFDALETRLERQHQNAGAGFPSDAAEEQRAAQLEEQIVSAERRIARLVQNRKSVCETLAGELKILASHSPSLRARARRLQALLERNAAQFRRLQNEARKSLQEMRLGTEYLNGMRANTENQPKFIDTCE